MSQLSLAQRYARALFEVSADANRQKDVLNNVREFLKIIKDDNDLYSWLNSSQVPSSHKKKAIQNIFAEDSTVEIKNFLLLLVDKKRFSLLPDIVNSLQSLTDLEHNVSRGVVKSAYELSGEARARVEEIAERIVNKKVIMSYEVHPDLLGGLVAQVDSYIFDDSIFHHLGKMNDQLNRSVH